MRDAPPLDHETIARCLHRNYGLTVTDLIHLGLGYDPYAATYEAVEASGTSWFLKIRWNPLDETALDVPRALIDAGIPHILAPVRTTSGELWCLLDGYPGHSVTIFPFLRGESAMTRDLTQEQWRAFGTTLRAVHDSDIARQFSARLRSETFALPSAALVREMTELVAEGDFDNAVVQDFTRFWMGSLDRIRHMLDRAEALGRAWHAKRFDHVPCHTDIHAANILVSDDGDLWLIDWDSPMLAPRERDLLFVIGSRIAREVTAQDEDWFFEGYGPVEIDPDALRYYRYERIIEDLGEFAKSVLVTPELSDAARAEEARMAMSFFRPDGDLERVEQVPRTIWPREPA